jgi:hypothetical protein
MGPTLVQYGQTFIPVGLKSFNGQGDKKHRIEQVLKKKKKEFLIQG